jgi:hypothetical protein
MERAVQKVRNRLLRVAAALEQAGVPYAVVGGNAVAGWVARVDESAVRNTQDVDLVLRRSDFTAARQALEGAGFVYRHAASVDMFLDGAEAKARDAVHVVFAGEKVRPEYAYPVPDFEPTEAADGYRMLALESLLKMKLTSFRDKDRVHIRDLIGVGLVDASWLDRIPAPLDDRLRELLDDPEG